jgi:hypothetical protein
MNYGKIFIKNYNNNLKIYCEEYIHNYKDQINSNKKFNRLFNDYENVLYDRLSELSSRKKSLKFFETSDSMLRVHKNDYIENITATIVENEIRLYFKKYQNQTDFLDFTDFLDGFAKYKAMYDMEEYIRVNKEQLEKLYEKNGIDNFFKIKKKSNELNRFEFDSKNDVKKKSKVLTDLSEKEKMIILHVLIHHYVDNTKRISSTIYFRVLSLCCSGLEDLDFYAANTNKTKYNYFSLGVNASTIRFKGDKKNIIDEIISKIKTLENIGKFIDALNRYKNTKI